MMVIRKPGRGKRTFDNEDYDDWDAKEKGHGRQEMGQAEISPGCRLKKKD